MAFAKSTRRRELGRLATVALARVPAHPEAASMTEAERSELLALVRSVRGRAVTADATLALIAAERRTRGRRALEQALGGRGGAPVGALQFIVRRGDALVPVTLAACTDAELESLGRRYRRESLEALARAERLAALLVAGA